jgi:hypothetical protein
MAMNAFYYACPVISDFSVMIYACMRGACLARCSVELLFLFNPLSVYFDFTGLGGS